MREEGGACGGGVHAPRIGRYSRYFLLATLVYFDSRIHVANHAHDATLARHERSVVIVSSSMFCGGVGKSNQNGRRVETLPEISGNYS